MKGKFVWKDGGAGGKQRKDREFPKNFDVVPKGWSQNRVKIFYLYNVKIEGGRGS